MGIKDEYWLEIAENPDVTVVLSGATPDWLPCIEYLENEGVNIYIQINMANGKLRNVSFETNINCQLWLKPL